MIEIIPAIIAKDFQELAEKIKKIKPFFNWAQLDVMDGKFVENATWNNPTELPILTENSSPLKFEAHLMVEKPEDVIDDWLKSGVKRIIFHYEATGKHQEIIDKIHQAGLEVGIALNPETPIDVLNEFICHSRPPAMLRKAKRAGESGNPVEVDSDWIPRSSRGMTQKEGGIIDIILIMSVNPGRAGQTFLKEILPKIRGLREKYQNVKIGVDGGINKETALEVIQAGADVLVIGSGIFEGDIEENIKFLQKYANN
jgi:ribulose-phosphate 3-epimerase